MVKPFISLFPNEQDFFVNALSTVMKTSRPYRVLWPWNVTRRSTIENLEKSYYAVTIQGTFNLYTDVIPTPAGCLEAYKWAERNIERVEYILALQGDSS